MTTIPENKSDLVDYIADQAGITKAQAGKALASFLEGITKALRAGKPISLLGFGNFVVKPRAARVGRNPKTGEPIQIEAANIPMFKAGKALKDAVNSGSVVLED